MYWLFDLKKIYIISSKAFFYKSISILFNVMRIIIYETTCIVHICVYIIWCFTQINGSTAFLCSITRANSFIACAIKVSENRSCVHRKESRFIRNVACFTLLILGTIVSRFLRRMARTWTASGRRVKIKRAQLDFVKLAQSQANWINRPT